MILISKDIKDKLFEHGRTEDPLEACGYLVGAEDEVTGYYPMKNTDQSPDHFRLDPAEQFSVLRKVREENKELLAVYHTHPVSPSRPSKEDIRLAFDPNIRYVIISLVDGTVQAYTISDGKAEEIPLEVA